MMKFSISVKVQEVKWLKERKQLIETGRRMIQDRLAFGSLGNLSMRLPTRARKAEAVLITPSGIEYEAMTPRDLIVLSLDGRVLEGSRRPSSETPMHLSLYKQLPWIRAIVHTHSLCATALSVARQPIPPIHYLIQLLGGSTVPVADYATFGTQELAANVAKALGDGGSAALMANHGAVTVGKSLEEAYARARVLEYLAEVYIKARLIGTPALLGQAQLEEVQRQFELFGQKG